MPCRSSNNSTAEFQECIDVLLVYEIIQSFGLTHIIMIGGDFNKTCMLVTSNNKRSKYISEFINESKLKTQNVGKTFIHSNGSDCSAIDYSLYPEHFSDNILHLRRLEITSNISDHYPVCANIKFSFSMKTKQDFKSNNGQTVRKINWHKIDKDLYKQVISDELDKCDFTINDPLEIDKAVTNINTAVTRALTTIAPPPKGKKRKPKLKFMTHNIYLAIKAKKNAFCEWKINGRPEIATNPLRLNKKQTTYELRKLCRVEKANLRITERQQLIDARTMDSKLFYQLIKKQRGKLNRFIDELQVGESSLKGDNNILEGWKTHFANLAKGSDPMNFDQDYFELVDAKYRQIIQICLVAYNHEEVTADELKKSCIS
ncbi:unnamed protein product [Mytilus coruscus]|uniref:Endonuclease/exonuclease/phosphatase domain-containing protein n=1 Tax=Mytilus coruscus TaxID=42192 RepID=A0A6J8BDA1_MYTCO|nr:unnamed protein product [Mytilus coruscus]